MIATRWGTLDKLPRKTTRRRPERPVSTQPDLLCALLTSPADADAALSRERAAALLEFQARPALAGRVPPTLPGLRWGSGRGWSRSTPTAAKTGAWLVSGRSLTDERCGGGNLPVGSR